MGPNISRLTTSAANGFPGGYYHRPHSGCKNSLLTPSRFTGSAGQAIISRNNAYMVTDSRYWLQARDQVDSNWTIIEAGKPGQPKDWIDFLSVREKCHFLASIFIVFR